MLHFIKNLLILFSLFLLLPQQAFSQPESIYGEEVSQLIDLVDQIRNTCTQKKCLFIGLGGSTTPLTETLSLDPQTKTMHLPLSSFKYTPAELNTAQLNKLYKHFDKVFEIEKISLERYSQIVIFDYAFGGRSLASSSYHLSSYLKHKEVNIDITTTFIGANETITIDEYGYPLELPKQSHNRHWLNSLTSEFHLTSSNLIDIKNLNIVKESFFHEKYDLYRKYPGFDIKKTTLLETMTTQYQVNQNYSLLKTYLGNEVTKALNSKRCNKLLSTPKD